MKKTSSSTNAKETVAEASVELLSFEAALQELDGVADKLETGRVPLEESLQLLRRGMSLIERCETELTQAEAVLEQLMLTSDGELQTVRLDVEEEDE